MTKLYDLNSENSESGLIYINDVYKGTWFIEFGGATRLSTGPLTAHITVEHVKPLLKSIVKDGLSVDGAEVEVNNV